MSEKTCNCDPCLEWLVPHDAEVTAIERERIIKLLENLDTEQWCGTNLQIVELIKGSENVGAEIENQSEGENK